LGPVLETGEVVRDLLWPPPGQRLTVLGEEGTRMSWDPWTGQALERRPLTTAFDVLAWGHDGSYFTTGSDSGLLRVVDAVSGKVRATLFHGSNAIRALALSHDGSRLFMGGSDVPGVKVFDPRRDPVSRSVPAQWQLCAMAFDERGETLQTIAWELNGDGANLEFIDVARGGRRAGPRLPVSSRLAYPRGDFAFSPDGRRLAAPRNRDDSIVGVWDVATGREAATLRAVGRVTALAYAADGIRLATGGQGTQRGHGELAIWDLASGSVVRRIDTGPRPTLAVALSVDGCVAAAGGGERPESGWAGAWDAETGRPLAAFDRSGLIMSLAFHPDGTRLAAADYGNQTLHIWDLKAGTEVHQPAPTSVSCLAFTPDGTRLASVGYDGQVHLADAQTAEEMLILHSTIRPPGGFGFTPRLAFSRDGSRLAANGVLDLSFWENGKPSGPPDQDPAPVDVAGWLRQGRAQSAMSDRAGAETSYARARALDDNDHDAAPWIEHALALFLRGDVPQGQEALVRAMGSLPDDPGRWAEVGRLLELLGRTQEAEPALTRARSLAQGRLSRDPDDGVAAAALAELLPDADASPDWTILQPDAMTSAAGTTLTRLSDSSVLASGLNPVVDTYTVEAMTGLSGITGLRLEAIPDPSLPLQGSGRDKGNFHLDSICVFIVSEGSAPVLVRLSRACADFSEARYGPKGVNGSLDTDPTTAWSIWPIVSRPHWAVFETARPIGTGPGMRLRVELASRSQYAQSTLGRFRLSVTNRPFPLFVPILRQIKADAKRYGLTRLGAAYDLIGDWASAAAVLGRADARPDATALDGFLLALARHHLGQHEEARGDCERALQRLGNDLADEAARELALKALVTTRGLGLAEAESCLLDLVFPADPFAH
jgi:WD40 repeat protein/tetratricopeptide (TPR) repeat protein